GPEVTVSPYSVVWNTAETTVGSHTVTAVVRDTAGRQATAAAVTVTVTVPGPDTVPPAIVITAPHPAATVSGSVTLTATASDNIGVAGVQFAVDGINVGSELTKAPYATSWDTSTVDDGTHTVIATARDAAGNQKWASITVTVNNHRSSGTSPGSMSYLLSDHEAKTWETANASAPIKVGYARVDDDSGKTTLGGLAIFSYHSNGVLVSEASVPLSPLVSSGRTYVEVSDTTNTGVAFANPGDDDAVISFYFTDASGRDFGNGSLTIPGKRQVSAFLTEAPFNLRNNLYG